MASASEDQHQLPQLETRPSSYTPRDCTARTHQDNATLNLTSRRVALPTMPSESCAKMKSKLHKSTTSFETKFALCGSLIFLFLLTFLAVACELVRQNGLDFALMNAATTTTTESALKWNALRIEQSARILSNTVVVVIDDDDVVKSRENQIPPSTVFLPCGDIFWFVKKEEENSSLQSDASYDQRVCSYAQNCDGDWPSRTFLPLILCHGVAMKSTFQGNETENEYENEQTFNPTNNSISAKTTLSSHLKSIFIYFLLPPILLLYLLLLFRLLATTADNYFSPALETFSFELGLPPRFAGATLLALGNGSPDLGSTVNAILLWDEATETARLNCQSNVVDSSCAGGVGGGGWAMGLGSLTGGGMFVGTIVCGLIVQSCGGITCRLALLRDISMYALSVCVVWNVLESGMVTLKDVCVFLGMYVFYVAIIFCADMYHKKVTLQRIQRETKMRRASMTLLRSKRASVTMGVAPALMANNNAADDAVANEMSPLMSNQTNYGEIIATINDCATEIDEECTEVVAVGDSIDTSTLDRIFPHPRLSVTDRFAMMMSNYDPGSVRFDLSSKSTSSDKELGAISNVLHVVRTHSHAQIETPKPETEAKTDSPRREAVLETLEEGQEDAILRSSLVCSENSSIIDTDGRSWSTELFIEAYQELLFQSRGFWCDRIKNETSPMEKMGSFLELPLTVIRSVTVPVPCEDHYIRPLVALSTAISPFWILCYLGSSALTVPGAIFCGTAQLIALYLLRYADDDKMPLITSVPLSLYGFFIAATWIDVIGGALVSMLQFLGTLTKIPGPILGMTVLAWGNSMGDLSANVAMARKGMPDMATTGCFAGPSFNLLVGTGFGFLALQHKLHMSSISPIALTPSICTGFIFIILNCSLAIICGMFCQWRIPFCYSYVLFILYALYVVISVNTVFKP